MGSSGSSDYSPAAQGPPPPAGSIRPQGSSTPHTPNFINFLGDTNNPATGLSPEMLMAIEALNGPPPGSAPPPPAPAPAAAMPPAGRLGFGRDGSGRNQLASEMGRGARGGGGYSGSHR